MRKILILLACCVALSGCADAFLKPQQLSEKDLNESTGVLIGSFSRDPHSTRYDFQMFYFKNADTGEKYTLRSQQSFNILNGSTPDDFTEQMDAGSTFAMKLPPGHYILYNFVVKRGVASYFSKNDFAIPFEVHPQSINYLGELKLEGTQWKNVFGMSVAGGGIWFITDKQARDIPLLRSAMPQLPLDAVISVIPTSKDIFTPLVVLPDEPWR